MWLVIFYAIPIVLVLIIAFKPVDSYGGLAEGWTLETIKNLKNPSYPDNGKILTDANGNEISESEDVTVKAGFFQKLISFFKNLFGANRIITQAFKKNIF